MTKVIIIDPKGWLGHPKGSVVDVNDPKAADLTSRKVAKKKVKEVAKPAKNKMMGKGKTK